MQSNALQWLIDGDAVTRGVAALLAVMSVLSWCLMLGQAWMLLRARRQASQMPQRFWQSADFDAGLQALADSDAERIFEPLARAARDAMGIGASHAPSGHSAMSLNSGMACGERVLRGVRAALLRVRRRLERGLTLLASIAATAPFIGLLGTVWSIYRALEKLALADRAAAGGVIGPVGESLIMTALGLGVAIPAVLGYNLLGRLARDLADDLDGFAHDLHAWACDQSADGTIAPDTARSPASRGRT